MKKNHSKRIAWVISIIADHLEMASNKEGRVGEVVAVDATSVLSDLFCGGKLFAFAAEDLNNPHNSHGPHSFHSGGPQVIGWT